MKTTQPHLNVDNKQINIIIDFFIYLKLIKWRHKQLQIIVSTSSTFVPGNLVTLFMKMIPLIECRTPLNRLNSVKAKQEVFARLRMGHKRMATGRTLGIHRRLFDFTIRIFFKDALLLAGAPVISFDAIENDWLCVVALVVFGAA